METDLNAGLTPRNSQVFSLNLPDKKALFMAFMPFIRQGGLFIHTAKLLELDDEVFVLLSLLDEPEKIMLEGKVVWITPQGAEYKRPSGIGVQLTGENSLQVRDKIETLLAGFIPPIEGSDTL